MTKTIRRLFLSPHHSTLLVVLGVAFGLAATSPLRAADHYPPRISHVDGSAAYIPSGRVDWEEITVNTPMLNGDRVFAQHDSRLEIELGDANFLRLADETDLTFETTLEDDLQLRLDEGVLILRLNKSRAIRVTTPYASIFMKKKGLYRLGVDDSGQMQVIVRKGRAYIETAGGTQKLKDGEEIVLGARYQGPMQVSQYSYQDEFDRWSDRRDARYMSSPSVAYLGGAYYPGVYDLDRYGYWTSYPGCGRVWIPQVSFGWSPYHSGFWGNFGFGFGWTWISYDPWGWLPYHYGNWYYYQPHRRWCWIPGGFRHWSPHRASFYHGGGYVGWAPTPYRFGNNTNVTVINNNTLINRPPREGLTVVRQDDFGTRGRTSDPALQASRAVVDNFRSGLPTDLSSTRSNTVRQAASNLQPGTRQTAASATVGTRSMNRSAAPLTSASRSPASVSPARTAEGNSVTQRSEPGLNREMGTSRVLRPDSRQRSESARPPSAVTLPLRSNPSATSTLERNYGVRRNSNPVQTQHQTNITVRSRTIDSRSERTSSALINSDRSVQRISRPSSRSEAPAVLEPNIGSEGTKSRAIPLPKSSTGSYSSRPGSSFSRDTITSRPSPGTTSRSTAGRSYSRPSNPAPSISTSRSRSSAPSFNRSFSSGRSSSPSRSYSRPSSPSRSSGSSGRSSAPSRGRSSGRSRPN